MPNLQGEDAEITIVESTQPALNWQINGSKSFSF